MLKYLSSVAGLIKNDHYITVDIDTWLVTEFDLRNGMYHFICNLFQKEQPYKLFFCIKILEIEDSMYFIFRNSRRIIEYNTIQRKVYHYGMQYEILKMLYRNAYYWNGGIVILPYHICDPILFFDVHTKNYVEKESFQQLFAQIGVELDVGEIFSYVRQGDKLWFCICESSWIGCVDFNSMSNPYLWQCKQSDRLWMAEEGTDSIFFTEKESRRFLKMNISNNSITLYDKIDSEMQAEEGEYRYIKSFGGKIIAIPYRAKSMTVIDRDGTIKNIRFPDGFRIIPEVRNIDVPFADYIVDSGKIYLFPFSCSGMLVIDMEDDTVSHYPMELRRRDIILQYYNSEMIPPTIGEGGKLSLGDFADIVAGLEDKNTIERGANTTGKKIFDALRGE